MQKWIFDIRSRAFFLLLLAFLILGYLAVAKTFYSQERSFEGSLQKIAGNPILDGSMQVFNELGWVLYPILVAIVLFIRKKTRRLGLVLLLSLLVGTIITAYLRCYTGYEKPAINFEGVSIPIKSGADVQVPCTIDGTFPAGHSVRTTILALIIGYSLSRRFPRGCYLIWAYPILVSISRLYLLQEYPSTVIAGSAFGFLVADIVSKKLKLELIFESSKT